jgi:hypothetical protein
MVADDALHAPVTSGSFEDPIELAAGTTSDALTGFFAPEYCGGDLGCGKQILPDGRIEKYRIHGCGAGGCSNHDHLYYGTVNDVITDFFEVPLSTNYPGVWRYLYQHGACQYEPTRACWGSLTEGADSGYLLAGVPLYHWVR